MKSRRFWTEENADSKTDGDNCAHIARGLDTRECTQNINHQNSHRNLELEETSKRSSYRLFCNFTAVNLKSNKKSYFVT